MSIESVAFVNVIGKISQLDTVIHKIADSQLMQLKPVKLNSKLKHFIKLNETNPYSQQFDQIKKILKMLKITPRFNDYTSLKSKSFDEIENIVFEAYDKLNLTLNEISKIKSKVFMLEQFFEQIKNMAELRTDLSKIFSMKFVEVIFGRMPIDSYLKLDHFADENFFFIPIKQDSTFSWGVFVAPKHESNDWRKLIDSLYFERLYSSEDISKNPAVAPDRIEQEIRSLKNDLTNLNQNLENYRSVHEQFLLCLYSRINVKHSTFVMRQFAVSDKKIFYINGFVLKKNVKQLTDFLEDIDGVVVEVLDEKESGLNPPVKLKTNFIFKPFELLIKTFGIPDYRTINATSLVGLVYCLLFGIMFGDFGQGVCLFIIGFVFWKIKKSVLGLVLTRCAVSSALFGLIYDSFFGFEGVFSKIWPSIGIFKNLPFTLLKGRNAVTILIISLVLGMVLIFISILINVVLNFKQKNFKDAFISNNGLVGLIFYGGFAAIAISLILFKTNIVNTMFLCFVIFLPVILIFLRQPILNFFDILVFKTSPKNKFSFLNSFLETFESVLNYFTNTLSFLRVGGFAMSHAALMLVVVKFCEKCSNFIASPLIAIFGNVFVLALEGLVVSIQVLRLIYYEVFSRFYKANGELFEPTKINF